MLFVLFRKKRQGMDQTKLDQLIEKYRIGQLSSSEAEELDIWFHSLNLTDIGFDRWISETGGESQMAGNLFNDFKQRCSYDKRYIKLKRVRWSIAAASVLLILSASSIFLLNNRPTASTQTELLKENDIAPGTNKAILTLSNGKKISLTDAHSGTVAEQANTQVNKAQNGQIVYIINNKNTTSNLTLTGKGDETGFNTIETPRGGQTSVTLSDGSVAYLDAASSIKFPVAFAGNERKVMITGQVYFEVVHKTDQPFRVVIKDEIIEDIGTHFNINAYDDEHDVTTTLTEGKIKLTKNDQSKLLNPGQQASVAEKSTIIRVSNADIEQNLAWKNGYFRFNQERIEPIMRKLSRWYNIDVEFKGPLPDDEFSGTISRFKNISAVFKALEYYQTVHFKVEGRRVIVSK